MDKRQHTTWGTRFRFLVRVIGITGVLAAATGAVLLDTVFPYADWSLDNVRAAGNGVLGKFAQVAGWTLVLGGVAVVLALAVEIAGGIVLVTGRRTAANTTATLGTVAAFVLLVTVNAISFTHHAGSTETHLAVAIAYLGSIPAFVGGFWILVLAFQESVWWGLGCFLFGAFVTPAFAIMHFKKAQKPFFIWVLGIALVGIGVAMDMTDNDVVMHIRGGRYDFTSDQRYTLPPELVERLTKLRTSAPTTIVVLQMHKTYGVVSDKRDSYTSEADRVVTDKVKDLVDLFRELGPRFNVVVFDTEAFGYDRAVADLTKDAPELKAAIDACPENSIFFHAPKHVQRLSFNEFLQLDKTASKEAQGGRGNLVLLPQGVESFAKRVLAVQERRPKVAIGVVHELLTSAYPKSSSGKTYTLGGLKDTLTRHGFDVIDVVLKKNWASARRLDDLKPSASTRDEAKLERLAGALRLARLDLASANREIVLFEKVLEDIDKVKGSPWRTREALYRRIYSRPITEETEKRFIDAIGNQLAEAKESRVESQKKVKDADAVLNEALKDEKTVEGNRDEDAKEKFAKLLADVDLLILPRLTIEDTTERESPLIAAYIHALSKEQVEVIRDFMVAGKPVLACLGPISGEDGPLANAPDGIERLIAERGIYLGPETILFDAESNAFAARLAGDQFGGGVSDDIPPLLVEEHTPAGAQLKPNPIAAAMLLTARGASESLDLRKKSLRQVSLLPGWQQGISFSSEFLMTGSENWNEERPFIQIEERRTADGRRVPVITYIPQFKPTAATDAKWGTPRAVRKGPFCIGVAIESKVPAAWVNEEYLREQFVASLLLPTAPIMSVGVTVAANQLERKTQRLVVFGSGNLFTGPKLDAAEQELLLHSANWLTGRTDRLPRGDLPAWSYPRVALSDRDFTLWQLGTAVALPLLAVYIGLLATMVRRLR